MTNSDRAIETRTIALDDRYRIECELSAGGMAMVCLASDLKHDRRVALKVLRAELAGDAVAVGERGSEAVGRRHVVLDMVVDVGADIVRVRGNIQRVGSGTATTSSPSLPMKSSG